MSKRTGITLCIVLVGVLAGSFLGPMLSAALTRVRSPGQVRAYLRSHPVRKLQIGAGTINYDDWLNTDIEPSQRQVYLDASQHFPIPDGSIHYIFAEQVIEHLTYEEGLAMLRECHRVLAPGGKIRLATPNLLKYFQLFQEPKTSEVQRFIDAKLKYHFWKATSRPESLIVNRQFRSFGHQYLYDPSTLSDSLAQAGFQDIAQFPPGESDDPQLRGIDSRHNDTLARESNDWESMVFQATRP
jgi:predicted SAM-dependent methyltransferase